MENFRMEVQSCGRPAFEDAIRTALVARETRVPPTVQGNVLTNYCVDPRKGLILLAAPPKQTALRLPDSNITVEFKAFEYPMSIEDIIPWAWGWLKNATYPDAPKGDFIAERGGFRVYCEDWGLVAGIRESVVALQPVWILRRP